MVGYVWDRDGIAWDKTGESTKTYETFHTDIQLAAVGSALRFRFPECRATIVSTEQTILIKNKTCLILTFLIWFRIIWTSTYPRN